MSHRATYVLGGPHAYRSTTESWGAIGLDLDLLAGPEVLVPLLEERTAPAAGFPSADDSVEAGVLADPRGKVLLTFAWEAAAASMHTRAAALELLRLAWPDWEVRWSYDGQTGRRSYLGLDPEDDHSFQGPPLACPPLGPDDEETAEPDPLAQVVTIGADRCHVLAATADHPLAEGPSVVERLRDAPRHQVYRAAAEGGIHIDPDRRRVGWWLVGAQEHPARLASRWPGWTVEFWADRWDEHVLACGGRFEPPAADRAAALAAVRDAALERWAGPRRDARGAVVAAAPDALVGLGFPPAVTTARAAAARRVVEAAYLAAAGR
ncbi:hypothetical protein AB0953_24410 [Streptomyces sp. NPDC046866]|uniref:hypothetical protein n=1 Tax=Streptomyces sp. NPDC046866 TaxID=3154921 RepID=UPI0034517EC0